MAQIIIGIDEAGYGPNLGPLVVAATTWRSGTASGELDLYDPLAAVVRPRDETDGSRRRRLLRDGERLLIADSKHVYSPAKGMAQLEHGVLACLDLVNKRTDDVARLWDVLSADTRTDRDALPWHNGHTEMLPLEADVALIQNTTRALAECCSAEDVELIDVAVQAVFPQRFNQLTEATGSKGRVNSDASLGLVRGMIEKVATDAAWAGDEVHVVCDKHGGRNRYAALLQSHFPDSWIEIDGESGRRSSYHWRHQDREITARFEVGAERHLPVALASMTAKYVRELAMRALNRYWCRQVSNLRPTAGYPVDARRFKRDIAEAQLALGIADDVLWRNR